MMSNAAVASAAAPMSSRAEPSRNDSSNTESTEPLDQSSAYRRRAGRRRRRRPRVPTTATSPRRAIGQRADRCRPVPTSPRRNASRSKTVNAPGAQPQRQQPPVVTDRGHVPTRANVERCQRCAGNPFHERTASTAGQFDGALEMFSRANGIAVDPAFTGAVPAPCGGNRTAGRCDVVDETIRGLDRVRIVGIRHADGHRRTGLGLTKRLTDRLFAVERPAEAVDRFGAAGRARGVRCRRFPAPRIGRRCRAALTSRRRAAASGSSRAGPRASTPLVRRRRSRRASAGGPDALPTSAARAPQPISSGTIAFIARSRSDVTMPRAVSASSASTAVATALRKSASIRFSSVTGDASCAEPNDAASVARSDQHAIRVALVGRGYVGVGRVSSGALDREAANDIQAAQSGYRHDVRANTRRAAPIDLGCRPRRRRERGPHRPRRMYRRRALPHAGPLGRARPSTDTTIRARPRPIDGGRRCDARPAIPTGLPRDPRAPRTMTTSANVPQRARSRAEGHRGGDTGLPPLIAKRCRARTGAAPSGRDLAAAPPPARCPTPARCRTRAVAPRRAARPRPRAVPWSLRSSRRVRCGATDPRPTPRPRRERARSCPIPAGNDRCATRPPNARIRLVPIGSRYRAPPTPPSRPAPGRPPSSRRTLRRRERNRAAVAPFRARACVLPTPPGPINVINRASPTRRSSCSIRSARPTNDDSTR